MQTETSEPSKLFVSLEIRDIVHSMGKKSDLIRWFFGTAATVLIIGTLLIGYWVTEAVENGVKNNAVSIKAKFVADVISPLVQDLQDRPALEDDSRAELNQLFGQGLLKTEIILVQIWTPSGIIAYSNDTNVIGRSFNQTDGMKLALSGQTYAEFDNVLDELSIDETLRTAPLLEIYTPLRSEATGQVIGVVELYADGTALRALLVETRTHGLVIVGAVALAMLGAIFLVVYQGAETIAQQRRALDNKVIELSGLLDQNRILARRVKKANLKLAELNESALRRISADLHDGPLQLLSFAGLRLESVNPSGDPVDLHPIKQTVEDAMREIRQICRGLSLPEISEWNLATVVRTAIDNHEKRTGIEVSQILSEPLPSLPLAAKTTVYRLLQETLNNGVHHGRCSHQKVTVAIENKILRVDVSDDGIGFDPTARTSGLGLAGLKERINSLGGEFLLETAENNGTSVVMLLPVEIAKDAA